MWSKEICKKFVALLVKNYKENSNTSQGQLLHDAQKQLIAEGVIEASDTRVWRGFSDLRGDLLAEFKTNHLETYTEIREGKLQAARGLSKKEKSEAAPAGQVQHDVAASSVVVCDMLPAPSALPSHNLVSYGAAQKVQSQLHKLAPRSFFVTPAQTIPILKTKKRADQPKMTEVSRVVHEEHGGARQQTHEDIIALRKRIDQLEELVLSQDDVIKALTAKFEKLNADLNSYLDHATAAAPVVAPVPAPAVKASADEVAHIPYVKPPAIVMDDKPAQVKPAKKPKAVIVCLFKPEQELARKALDDKYELTMLEPDSTSRRITEHSSTADIVFIMTRYISHTHETASKAGIEKAKNAGRSVRLCKITGSMSALRNLAKKELTAFTTH